MTPRIERIVLRMSSVAKLLYVVIIAVSLWFTFECIRLLTFYDRLSTRDLGGLVLGIAFFGGGALLILRQMMKSAGYLEIRDNGLLVDTYISGGFIPWENLTAVGAVRSTGVRYLGLAMANVESYLASRSQTPVLNRTFDRALAQGFLRLMLTVAPMKVVNTVLYMLGFSKLPEFPTEDDILRWNRENFGYQVLIQGFWVPNFDQTIAAILASKTASCPSVLHDAEKIQRKRRPAA